MQQNIVKYPAHITPTMSHGKLFSEGTQLETPIFQRQLGFYLRRRFCFSLSLCVCVFFSHTQPHHSQEITESQDSLFNRIGYNQIQAKLLMNHVTSHWAIIGIELLLNRWFIFIHRNIVGIFDRFGCALHAWALHQEPKLTLIAPTQNTW